MILVSTAGNIFGRKTFFVSTFLDKYTVMLFKFEKFDSESKIHIEKLQVFGYNSIKKFS